MSKFIISLLLFLCSGVARADCEPRDFNAELGPVRDQDETAWCFASAAADLVTQRVHARISALALGAGFFATDPAPLLVSENPQIRQYLSQHADFSRTLTLIRTPSTITMSHSLREILEEAPKEEWDLSRRGIF